MKKAFTLIELVLVIVILGIISVIGTDIFRSLFDTYATTAQTTRLEISANNAADIIASRLEHRIPQTTGVTTITQDGVMGKDINSLSEASNNNDDGLVFFRRAYELERNFATAKAGPAYKNLTSLNGFITHIKTETTLDEFNTAKPIKEDKITLTMADSNLGKNKINQNSYVVFMSNDNALIYHKRTLDKALYFEKQPLLNGCNNGSIEFNDDNITINRQNCFDSTGIQSDLIRPSMATTTHKLYLSKEIDKIFLDDDKNLYLFTCPVNEPNCDNKSIIARGVSTFRFTALSSDPNASSGIVLKICLKEDESEVCQSRMVR